MFHSSKMQFGYQTYTSQIRFLGDPTAKFTEALDLAFDGTAIFGGPRSKRYVLEIEDGKVKAVHVEPDNTGLNGKPLQLVPD
jgi:2-Cys peroxiredoxin 5